jgi:hypothetical protein
MCMRYISALLLFISVGFLSACTTSPAQQRCIDSTPAMSAARWNCLGNAREQDKKVEEANRNREYISRLQAKCDALGFRRGTDANSQCLLAQQQQENANAAAAYQQQQQLFNNAQQLLRGDGGGQVNCYSTPGVPNSAYCR